MSLICTIHNMSPTRDNIMLPGQYATQAQILQRLPFLCGILLIFLKQLQYQAILLKDKYMVQQFNIRGFSDTLHNSPKFNVSGC